MHDTYSYDLVERLSFLRYGGTEDELRAANILLDEIKALGGEGHLESFQIPACELKKYSAKIIAPYEKELEVMAYGRSGTLPQGGVDLKLYYAERGLPEDYLGMDDLSDTAVIINELNYDAYKLLCQKKAAAFITISNKHWDTKDNHDLIYRPLRSPMLDNGKIPCFMIWASDATDLVRDGASMIHLELEAEEMERTSQNVVATIPGTEITDESIVITAHYDSVLIGTGAWDNATGSATIMYIYRHFLQHKPRRTLHFVWCGTEEQGLLGSKAYVEQHPEQIEKEIKFCFNFDMCGTVLGPNLVFVTGGDDLKHLAEQFCREYGMSADIKQIVHSSDSAPFCDKGIPALGLSRGSKTCEIHTRNDIIFPLSAKQLQKDGDFAAAFIGRVANSRIIPVPMGMPEPMKENLKKYFMRDKTTLAQDAEKANKAKEEEKK